MFANSFIILPSMGQEGTCIWLLDFVSDAGPVGGLDID